LQIRLCHLASSPAGPLGPLTLQSFLRMTLNASAQKRVHYVHQIGLDARLIVGEAIQFPSPSIKELATQPDQDANLVQRDLGALERILNRGADMAVGDDLVAQVEGVILPDLPNAR